MAKPAPPLIRSRRHTLPSTLTDVSPQLGDASDLCVSAVALLAARFLKVDLDNAGAGDPHVPLHERRLEHEHRVYAEGISDPGGGDDPPVGLQPF